MARGYSFGALVDAALLQRGDLGTTDLNTMYGPDYFGVWGQQTVVNATTANNYPSPSAAGTLEILPNSRNGGFGTIQRLTDINNTMYSRVREGSSWTAWKSYVSVSEVYKAIYPIGICLDFDNVVNPNILFPGTTWAQILDGRTVRSSTSNVAGSGSGQIGSWSGSDSFTIAVANLPAHSHSVAQHTHDMDHTHSISHNHPSGTTDEAGDHTHSGKTRFYNPSVNGGQSGSVIFDTINGLNFDVTSTVLGTNGAHRHTFQTPAFSGVSGPVSVGATKLGGPTSTGSVGSGTSITQTGQVRYYARWKRTA